MSTQHTPGPWKHGYVPRFANIAMEIHGESKGFAVAHVLPSDTTEGGAETRLANARLIAAAPELLAAAYAAIDALEIGDKRSRETLGRLARAAINKATT